MILARSPGALLNDAKSHATEAHEIVSLLAGAELGRRDGQALRYCLIVVGEALNRLSPEFLAREPAVPWRQVIALRHRLVHAYWLIDEGQVAEIARNETPDLIAALDRLIQDVT